MEIFAKNCKAIEANNTLLPEKLLAYKGESVALEETRSGDFTFRFEGKYFHSLYDPVKEAHLQAEEILSKKADWVFLFGVGCGYLLKELAARKKEKIVVYEPSLEILSGVLHRIDLSEILSGDSVYIFNDIQPVVNIVRDQIDGFDNILSYQSTPYKLAFPAKLKEFTNKVQNAHTTNKVGIKTDIDSRLSWINNYFDNLRHFDDYPNIDCLRGRLKDIPLIIVGAGPSLRKNAHLLREVKGKAVIIAAITAYKPLLKHGVVPDFIIASEKVDLPEYFTFGEEDRKTRLILAEISHPNMFDRDVKGKFIFFNPYINLSFETGRDWGCNYFPSSGGSVTTVALDMGVAFGCDPIIFMGQDLSFGDGQTHAEGGVYVSQDIKIDRDKGEILIEEDYVTLKDKAKSRFNLQWLKGLSGQPVPSKFDWVTFHQWFENYMSEMRLKGIPIKVFNSTEGGAYIEGMEHATFKDVMNRYLSKEIDLETVINDAIDSRPSADYGKLLKTFTKMLGALKHIHRTADEILRETRQIRKGFMSKGISEEFRKNAAKIKRLEECLFEEAKMASFIWESLASNTFELKEYLRDEEDERPEAAFKNDLDRVEASYRKVLDMCEKFLPALNNTVRTIKEKKRALESLDPEKRRYEEGRI